MYWDVLDAFVGSGKAVASLLHQNYGLHYKKTTRYGRLTQIELTALVGLGVPSACTE